MWQIIQAETGEQIETARAMFVEYAEGLGISLCFQGFDQEMATLPGRYAPPSGRLLLATDGTQTAGVIALRRIDNETCEMKRLYVRPAFRGEKLGRRLAEFLLDEAHAIGYRRMILDTLEGKMDDAIALYQRLGFEEIPPYDAKPGVDAGDLRLVAYSKNLF